MDRCAGLDWAKDAHQVCVLEVDGEPLVQRGFAHDERGLDGMCELLVELGVKRLAIERPDGVLVERLLLISAEISKRHGRISAHGQLTFKTSHRLARGKAFESLRTQSTRMVPAAHSRGPGCEQGSGKPVVDEAGSPRRRSSGSKAPTRSWSTAAPERGATRQGARASGAGS